MNKLLIAILIAVLAPCSAGCFGQSWTGVLSTSRAIDWSKAGLPTTLPDGEVTINPWTPPIGRTQCGSTITSGASVSTINAALAACSPGTYVLLGAGSFSVSNTQLRLVDTSGGTIHNGVSLRGSGPNSTKVTLTGTATIVFGNAWSSGSATWTAGFSQGATSLTMGSVSGAIPGAGQIITLAQCDTGQSGTGCATGSISDNGGIFLCGGTTLCANQAGNNTLQSQTVLVTGVTSLGGGSYTVTFSPGLYMLNWSLANSPTVGWIIASSTTNLASPSGIGLEDLTVDITGVTGNFGIQYTYCYGCWIKGVRIVGSAAAETTEMETDKNSIFVNSMVDDYSYAQNALSLSLQVGTDSDDLILNNILLHGLSYEGLGSNEGDVIAYNLISQTHTLYYEANPFQHTPGNAFTLYEGNQTGHITDDDTWGSANLNTFFRNYMNGADPPYLLASSCGASSCVAMKVDGFHRFDNIIGNVIGGQFLTSYQAILSTPTNGVTNNAVYRWSADASDPLTMVSAMRWGNVDSVINAPRYCGPGSSGFTSAPCSSTSAASLSASEVSGTVTVASTLNPGAPSIITMTGCSVSGYNGVFMVTVSGGSSFQYANANTGLGAATGCTATTGSEVPTALVGNAASLNNFVPSATALPCSFFLAGYTSITCSSHPNGGTGLNWWKVVASWTTFPTTPLTTQTQPFPAIGPDVASGPYVSGYAYDIPAAVAFNSTAALPIDSIYQNTYSVSSYSWSGGVETIVVTGLPANSAHIMGGFQISGATGACNSAAGMEFVMTGSTLSGTTGTITYAISNPGSCSGGSMLFPDVRQFDEGVYETDSQVSSITSTFSGAKITGGTLN